MKKNNSTCPEASLVYSPLCQRIARDGIEVDTQIYRGSTGGWLLEVVDPFGNSTVWDDLFPTNSAAFAEACQTMDTEGIGSLAGSAPAGSGKGEDAEDTLRLI